jgi:uncharacterized protein involved in exopolysaccharide biosynthesis
VDLGAFLRFLARRGWLVLLGAALGGALGLAWAAAQTPVYEGLTRVKVFPARPGDLGQAEALKDLLQSFTLDVPTRPLALLAAAELGVSEAEAERIRGHVTASADPNVFEIQVKARSADPAEAERWSDAWARAFIAQRSTLNLQLDLNERIEATLRDAATHSLYAPRRGLSAAVGAALGALLGLGLALLWEYLARAPGPAGEPERARVARAGRGLAGTTVRRGWPVLVLGLLGALTALAVSRMQSPEYRARSRIAVEPGRAADWGQTQVIQAMLSAFGADIATRRMAGVVADRQALDLPADTVLGWATVAPEPQDYEIYLDIRHPDRAVAEAVSRGWAEAFLEERNQANLALDQRDRTLVRLRDATTSELWRPRTLANVLAGLALGLLAGLGLAYLAWWWPRRRAGAAP